ncbi:MAG TPA: hypothetical protein VFI42_15835 [Thermomicrobiaceae bacterium]|nr:hypothetical protein [Thermomicrobiaceae bacterium]
MTHATEHATLTSALAGARQHACAVLLIDGYVLVEQTPAGYSLPQITPPPGEPAEVALSRALDVLGLAHTRLSYLSSVWSYAPDPATRRYVDRLESFFRVEAAGDPRAWAPEGYAWVAAAEAVARLASGSHARTLDELHASRDTLPGSLLLC